MIFGNNRRIGTGMPYEMVDVLSANAWEMNDNEDEYDIEDDFYIEDDFDDDWWGHAEDDDNVPDLFNEAIVINDGALDPANDMPISTSSSASNSLWFSVVVNVDIYSILYIKILSFLEFLFSKFFFLICSSKYIGYFPISPIYICTIKCKLYRQFSNVAYIINDANIYKF